MRSFNTSALNVRQGKFIIYECALPPNSGATLSSDAILAAWKTFRETGDDSISSRATTTCISKNLPTQQIVEAQGRIVDAHGKVFLTT